MASSEKERKEQVFSLKNNKLSIEQLKSARLSSMTVAVELSYIIGIFNARVVSSHELVLVRVLVRR